MWTRARAARSAAGSPSASAARTARRAAIRWLRRRAAGSSGTPGSVARHFRPRMTTKWPSGVVCRSPSACTDPIVAGGRGAAAPTHRGTAVCPGPGRYGFWKPASWRIFCPSGEESQATNAAAASAFSDCFRVAAGYSAMAFCASGISIASTLSAALSASVL